MKMILICLVICLTSAIQLRGKRHKRGEDFNKLFEIVKRFYKAISKIRNSDKFIEYLDELNTFSTMPETFQYTKEIKEIISHTNQYIDELEPNRKFDPYSELALISLKNADMQKGKEVQLIKKDNKSTKDLLRMSLLKFRLKLEMDSFKSSNIGTGSSKVPQEELPPKIKIPLTDADF